MVLKCRRCTDARTTFRYKYSFCRCVFLSSIDRCMETAGCRAITASVRKRPQSFFSSFFSALCHPDKPVSETFSFLSVCLSGSASSFHFKLIIALNISASIFSLQWIKSGSFRKSHRRGTKDNLLQIIQKLLSEFLLNLNL